MLQSLASSTSDSSYNSTIWFSHYPSSTIVADHRVLRELMFSSVAHVCGHLHDMQGRVENLYGRHPSGHLELELSDFKDHRMSVLNWYSRTWPNAHLGSHLQYILSH